VTTRGENINIRWSPNGNTIAVGNKEDLLTFVDARTFKIINEEQFKYEVQKIHYTLTSTLLNGWDKYSVCDVVCSVVVCLYLKA